MNTLEIKKIVIAGIILLNGKVNSELLPFSQQEHPAVTKTKALASMKLPRIEPCVWPNLCRN